MTVLGNRTMRWRDAGLVIVRRDDIGIGGFDLLIDAKQAAALVAALRATGAIEIDTALAETLRVEAGVPRFGQDMDEDTIPLEAGIEDRAISMSKGCYVGQEIIVRVLHRGHGRVARKLVLLRVERSDVDGLPQKGDRIHSAERDVGFVTSAVESPAIGSVLAMGYVHRDFVEAGTAVAIDRGGVRTPAVVTLPR
jgi:folate-binding protein YgfZ